ncbi:MAG: TIGR02757 family protein [Bdellovibrionales bacterium]|nr:TIGR02757 family protein [Bdellovibrionales bacterium]
MKNPPPLKNFLDPLFSRYHRREYLVSDPLEFVHQFTDPWDQEVVAILAALLAYGNVRQIRASVQDALSRMSEVSQSPQDYVRRVNESRVQDAMRGWVHRFNTGDDLILLFQLIHQSWQKWGSVGAHLISHHSESAQNIEAALNGLMGDWVQGLPQSASTGSVRYFLTAPKDGSCCKRWCMLLRWMVRKDELDLGLWGTGSGLEKTFPQGRFVHSHQLVIPLDTHTGRISQYIGLTERKSLGWAAALEVTQALKKANADDPVRYDFALSRLGILSLCQKKFRAEICEKCDLLPSCRFARRSLKS